MWPQIATSGLALACLVAGGLLPDIRTEALSLGSLLAGLLIRAPWHRSPEDPDRPRYQRYDP